MEYLYYARSGKRPILLFLGLVHSVWLQIAFITSILSVPVPVSGEQIQVVGNHADKDFIRSTMENHSTFSCLGLNGFYPDPAYRCIIFYLCAPDGSRLIFHCPAGKSFQMTSRSCMDISTVSCLINDNAVEKMRLPVHGGTTELPAINITFYHANQANPFQNTANHNENTYFSTRLEAQSPQSVPDVKASSPSAEYFSTTNRVQARIGGIFSKRVIPSSLDQINADVTTTPDPSFHCLGRQGYFPDLNHNCTIYYFCDETGEASKFQCLLDLAFDLHKRACVLPNTTTCSISLASPVEFSRKQLNAAGNRTIPPSTFSVPVIQTVGPTQSGTQPGSSNFFAAISNAGRNPSLDLSNVQLTQPGISNGGQYVGGSSARPTSNSVLEAGGNQQNSVGMPNSGSPVDLQQNLNVLPNAISQSGLTTPQGFHFAMGPANTGGYEGLQRPPHEQVQTSLSSPSNNLVSPGPTPPYSQVDAVPPPLPAEYFPAGQQTNSLQIAHLGSQSNSIGNAGFSQGASNQGSSGYGFPGYQQEMTYGAEANRVTQIPIDGFQSPLSSMVAYPQPSQLLPTLSSPPDGHQVHTLSAPSYADSINLSTGPFSNGNQAQQDRRRPLPSEIPSQIPIATMISSPQNLQNFQSHIGQGAVDIYAGVVDRGPTFDGRPAPSSNIRPQDFLNFQPFGQQVNDEPGLEHHQNSPFLAQFEPGRQQSSFDHSTFRQDEPSIFRPLMSTQFSNSGQLLNNPQPTRFPEGDRMLRIPRSSTSASMPTQLSVTEEITRSLLQPDALCRKLPRGFYPMPGCRDYFYCSTFGERLNYSCPTGLLWNTQTGQCEVQIAVKCTNPVRTEGHISSSGTVTSRSEFTHSRSRCFGLVPGRYANVEDGCRSFVICDGTEQDQIGPCSAGMLFDNTLKDCVASSSVECSKRLQLETQKDSPAFSTSTLAPTPVPSASTLTHTNPTTDVFSCAGKSGFFANNADDCRSYFYCAPDGKHFTFPCPPNYLFSDSKAACDIPDKTTCSKMPHSSTASIVSNWTNSLSGRDSDVDGQASNTVPIGTNGGSGLRDWVPLPQNHPVFDHTTPWNAFSETDPSVFAPRQQAPPVSGPISGPSVQVINGFVVASSPAGHLHFDPVFRHDSPTPFTPLDPFHRPPNQPAQLVSRTPRFSQHLFPETQLRQTPGSDRVWPGLMGLGNSNLQPQFKNPIQTPLNIRHDLQSFHSQYKPPVEPKRVFAAHQRSLEALIAASRFRDLEENMKTHQGAAQLLGGIKSGMFTSGNPPNLLNPVNPTIPSFFQNTDLISNPTTLPFFFQNNVQPSLPAFFPSTTLIPSFLTIPPVAQCPPGKQGYFPDMASDCRNYMFCDGHGGKLLHSCPPDMSFNASLFACDLAIFVECQHTTAMIQNSIGQETKAVSSCFQRRAGYYAEFGTACSEFYYCALSGPNGFPEKFSYKCPLNFFFDEFRGVCVENGACIPSLMSLGDITAAGAMTHSLIQMNDGRVHQRFPRQHDRFSAIIRHPARPNNSENSTFDCRGKTTTFHTDFLEGCRKFHHCTAEGSTLSYTCPFDWLFNEKLGECVPPEEYTCSPMLVHTNFSCFGKFGYYADIIHRCRVFYQCRINGSSTTMSCPPSMVFDENEIMCIYGDVCNPPAVPADQVEIPSSVVDRAKQPFQCPSGSSVFFGDPLFFCRVYWQCVGGVKVQNYTCPGYLQFNATTGACDKPNTVICRDPFVLDDIVPGLISGHYSATSRISDDITRSQSSRDGLGKPNVGDSLVERFNQPSRRSTCDPGQRGFFADLDSNCRTFFYCANDLTKRQFACPGQMVFDEMLSRCQDHSFATCSSPKTMEILSQRQGKSIGTGQTASDLCRKGAGAFADLKSGCRNFITCHRNGSITNHTCPSMLLFNDKKSFCDWPFNIQCGEQMDLSHGMSSASVKLATDFMPDFHGDPNSQSLALSRNHPFAVYTPKSAGGSPVPYLQSGLAAALPDNPNHLASRKNLLDHIYKHLRQKWDNLSGTTLAATTVGPATTAGIPGMEEGEYEAPEENILPAPGTSPASLKITTAPPTLTGPKPVLAPLIMDTGMRVEAVIMTPALTGPTVLLNSQQSHGIDCHGKNGYFFALGHRCKTYVFCKPSGVAYGFTCPGGQLYNADNEICDRPENVICLEGSSHTATNIATRRWRRSVTHSRMGSESPATGLDCPLHNTYFANKTDGCLSFYYCTENSTLISYECPDVELRFDEVRGVCDWGTRVKCGNDSEIPMSHLVNSSKLDEEIANQDPGRNCTGIGFLADLASDCRNFTFCTPEGSLLHYSCPDGSRYDESSDNCQNHTLVSCNSIRNMSRAAYGKKVRLVTRTRLVSMNGETSADCRNRRGLYADPRSRCANFFYCSPQGLKFEYACPDNMAFNNGVNACDDPTRSSCSPLP